MTRFRDAPIDVYICDPQPKNLAEMLRDRLRSNRVHSFSVYWNVLAWAFTQVLEGKMDPGLLHYLHELTLDAHGASFLPRVSD